MAEGLAEMQRDEETFVGPQEGGTKDRATLGMPAGGCFGCGYVWEVWEAGPLPLSSYVSGRSDFTSWSSHD